ncbi:MAG: tetratricopeptide repeat protein [Chthoniobacterales bacterium]
MSTPLKRVRRTRRRKAAFNRREQIRLLLLLALVVVVGFFLGLFGFSSFHKGWNRWRETRLLREAGVSLQQQDAGAAEQAARKAIALNPGSVEASRILAEATERQNRPETVAWRAQVARLAPSLDSDLNLASAALRFGQLDLARDALDKVAPADVDKAAYHVVAGWLARAQGNHAEEERHFAAAVARAPANDVYQFNLAVLRILSPDPEKSAAARNQLERLSKVPQFRTPALRALLENAVRQNQMPAAEGLAQDLQMSQQVSFSDYLLCLDLYKKLNRKKFSALLDKVKPVAARDGGDLAQLIDWMNQNDLESEALKWSEKLSSSLTSQPPAAISIAEALAQTHNFSRLKRWSRSGSWGDDEYLRLAYQAYAARESRHATADAESDALWHSAVEAAADQPERETALARLASQWQLTQEAEQLWQRVAKTAPHRREALEALYRIYRQSNDLANLRDIAQRLQESSPDEIGLGANAARLALLLDRNTAAGQQLAQEIYEKAPNDTAAAVTYAFALYGTGRTQNALEVLKKLPPEQLREPHAAVYAALILDDDNQVAAADEYIKLAKAGKLFPEEKRLLEDIAARRQSAAPSPAPRAEPSATPTASPPARK